LAGAQEYFLPHSAGYPSYATATISFEPEAKLCKFCWRGAQEYFLPQGAGYPSYATERTCEKYFATKFRCEVFRGSVNVA